MHTAESQTSDSGSRPDVTGDAGSQRDDASAPRGVTPRGWASCAGPMPPLRNTRGQRPIFAAPLETDYGELTLGDGEAIPGVDASSLATVALADIDADGDLEILHGVTGWGNYDPDGSVFVRHAVSPAISTADGVILAGRFELSDLADMDGDGDLDIFGAGHTFENTGTPAAPTWVEAEPWDPETLDPLFYPSSAWRPQTRLGDLDADGDPDAIRVASGWPLCFHENVGTLGAPSFGGSDGEPGSCEVPNLGIQGYLLTEPPPEPGTRSVAVPAFDLGDLDGDGDLDLLGWTGSGWTYLLFAENDGTPDQAHFTPWVRLATDTGYNARSLALGDVDCDGDLDTVIYGTTPSGAYGLIYLENVTAE